MLFWAGVLRAEVYMFSSCYLRLCNEPYDLGDLANRQRHISNWCPACKGAAERVGGVDPDP